MLPDYKVATCLVQIARPQRLRGCRPGHDVFIGILELWHHILMPVLWFCTVCLRDVSRRIVFWWLDAILDFIIGIGFVLVRAG